MRNRTPEELPPHVNTVMTAVAQALFGRVPNPELIERLRPRYENALPGHSALLLHEPLEGRVKGNSSYTLVISGPRIDGSWRFLTGEFNSLLKAIENSVPESQRPASDSFTLRPARTADHQALIALLRATFLDTWAPQMSAEALARWEMRAGPEVYVREKGADFLVAERDGALAGMIHWHDGFVHALHVAAAHRRKGIGAALMARAEAAARAAGLMRLRLETDTFNQPSQALYRALGFVEIDRYPDTEHDAGITTVLLEKML